jgi:hypothetical protein
MRKNLLSIILFIVTLFGLTTLTSCSSDADTKVNNFVENLNSDNIKSEFTSSGLFSDVETKIDGNIVLFHCKTTPAINFADYNDAKIATNRTAMIATLKAHCAENKTLREGFEGMQEKGMTFRVRFEDTAGNTPQFDIAPSLLL